jgi:ATP-dependent exoDNAse (exonuclease V) beta subunit
MSISRWLESVKETPYAILLEEILTETGAWKYFHEKQRYVNVKKFIKLVEGFQQRGLTGLEIKEKLIKASRKSEEAKANVNTEGMDAVKILTIHASKGLQFPVVFLPCLDEDAMARGANNVIIDEHDKGVVIAYEDDPNIRKKMPVFNQHRERLLDEEKRLFYVSATRAMDYLCMSGVSPNPETKSPSGKLAYIVDSFNLINIDSTAELPFKINKVRADVITRSVSDEVISKEEIATPTARNDRREIFSNEPIFIELLNYVPSTVWSDVTEEIEEVMTKHGDDWVVLGRAFHRIFEGISKGYIIMENLEKKTIDILKNEVLTDSGLSRMKDIILSDIGRLDEAGYLKDIILPQDNSYSELPFILGSGNRVYKGRIDRVIIKRGQEAIGDRQEDAIAYVYDYKTYPVAEKEISELVERYSFQMNIYKKAVERLFNANPIRKDGLSNRVKAASYIFFTHELKLVPVK